MKIEIRKRDRRALAALMAALAVYVVLDQVALPAYDRLRAADILVAEREDQLERHRQALARGEHYEDLMAELVSRTRALEATLIEADSPALAAVELQSRVETAAESAGLTLSQRTAGQIQRVGDIYAELPLTVSFESAPARLVAFLGSLRALGEYVTVKQLRVTPLQQVQEVLENGDLDRRLRVNMTIAALTPSSGVVGEEGL